jgi:UDP:flavonoid glycosyltransferase YjiC (YdhE family)
MRHIVYAWELGAGYGHLAAFLPLAKALRAAGHEVTFVIKELTHAETLLGPGNFTYLQAPLWQLQLERLTHPINYAEILFKVGYLSQPGVAGLVKAWRKQLALLRPDLLIVDHGPTPLLASRGASFKRMLLGSGFYAPPRITPMPSIRPELNVDSNKLFETENQALSVINSVAQDLQLPPLKALCELFDVDANLISAFPELDLYPQRGAAEYIGPSLSLQEGARFDWPGAPDAPDMTAPKVFVYLQAGFAHTEKIIAALSTLKVRAVVHSPVLDPALVQKYAQAHLLFSTAPLHMEQVSREADIALCNAGLGTVSAMLLAGTPMLLFPTHQEQFLLASAVVRLGAGILVMDAGQEPDLRKWIMSLIAQPSYVAAAAAFQEKYRGFHQAQQLEQLVARCEQLLRG